MAHRSVLAVFAHPDDAELACFGTLAGLGAAGFRLHLLALSTGSNSSSPVAVFRPTEAKEAAGVIGAELVIEDFVDGALQPDRAVHACVAEHLERLRPAVVITHLVGAADHQDHEAAGRVATTMAWRSPWVRLILQAEPPVMNNLFHPDLFVDVTTTMADKLAAIGRYRSERGKPYMSEEAILARGAWWARQAEVHDLPDVRYYEAFRMVKAKLDARLLAAFGPVRPG